MISNTAYCHLRFSVPCSAYFEAIEIIFSLDGLGCWDLIGAFLRLSPWHLVYFYIGQLVDEHHQRWTTLVDPRIDFSEKLIDMRFRLNPVNQRRWQNHVQTNAAFWSLCFISIFLLCSGAREFMQMIGPGSSHCNNQYYFPIFSIDMPKRWLGEKWKPKRIIVILMWPI